MNQIQKQIASTIEQKQIKQKKKRSINKIKKY